MHMPNPAMSQPFFSQQLAPANLPNQDGFQFIGRLETGVEVRCEVRKSATGMHAAYSGDQAIYSLLVSWRRGIADNRHMPTFEEMVGTK